MRNTSLLSSVLVATIGLSAAVATAQPVSGTQPSKPIAGQYIVVFKNSVSDAPGLGRQLAAQAGGQFLHGYSNSIKGFSLRLPAKIASKAIQALAKNPNVSAIESDATVSATEALMAPPVAQNGATWGLDRIDQVDRPLSSQYLYQYQGSGVYAFVVDTGILPSHIDFGGRVLPGTGFISDGLGSNDCNGHGTHVAGTIAGSQWGVAKNATLVPVRVLDCAGSGTWSGVIAGIDWVAGQTSLRPAVANMSLSGGKSSTVNAAVAAAVAKGVTMVVAAGNSNADACSYSPSSEPSALTVAATTNTDARASYSNYGSCVDLFAPGSSITSTWNTSNSATQTISGTSMASPHAAGVAALALAANPQSTPDMVTRFLLDNASVNKVSSAGTGTPNKLVYSLADGAPQAPVLSTVRVATIAGSAAKSGRSAWIAYATVKIQDQNGAFVANAKVTGSFLPGGSAACVTDATGSCRLSSAKLSYSKVKFADFSVSGVSGTNMSYDASQNGATQIRILRP